MGDLARLRDQSGTEDSPGGDETPKETRVSKRHSGDQIPNLYCLDQRHDPRLLTEARFFYWDMNQPGCPICPVCQKEVNAQFAGLDAKGRPVIPENLRVLQDRIGERV